MKIVTILTKEEIITAMHNFLGERIKDFAQVTNIDFAVYMYEGKINTINFILDFDTEPESEVAKIAYDMLKDLPMALEKTRSREISDQPKVIKNLPRINEDDIKEEDPHRPADIFGNLKDQVARVQSAVADVKEAVDEIQTPGSLWLAYQKSGKYEDMLRWLKHAAWERLDSNTRAGNWTWVELARITQTPPAPSEGEKLEESCVQP
jgi:hypothetical protein